MLLKKILSAVFCCLSISILVSSSALAGPPQYSDVYAPFGCDLSMPGDCSVVGASKLVRAGQSVQMNIWTSELDPNAVYTVWWVVFNNPEYCIDGCNGADLAIDEVLGAVIHAAGHPVGGNGTGNFAASLQEGDISGDQPFELPGNALGLIDASKAEIHLVVRTHGEKIQGLVKEQLSTFDGGCDINICEDQQFAIHL